MKLFFIALAVATIALSDCDTGTHTSSQTQATLIDKHKEALILLLEVTQEELKEKISAKGASIRAKEKKVAEINKSLATLDGEQLIAAAEEKNSLPGEIKKLAEAKNSLETRQQKIAELLKEFKKINPMDSSPSPSAER